MGYEHELHVHDANLSSIWDGDVVQHRNAGDWIAGYSEDVMVHTEIWGGHCASRCDRTCNNVTDFIYGTKKHSCPPTTSFHSREVQ